MASVLCEEDLTCCVCLSIFTDPLTLPCGHSFCKPCVAVINSCPQCRAEISAAAKRLPTSVVLKSLAEKTREAERRQEESEEAEAEVPDLCPEHGEKLELFCITGQQLACVKCRDGEKHEGHELQSVEEAAASLRRELETFAQDMSLDIQAKENMVRTQRREMTKAIETSQQLLLELESRFEEMHQYLVRREAEAKHKLKQKLSEGLVNMNCRLNEIDKALSERKRWKVKATSVLKISDPEKFLKSYTEKSMTTTEDLSRPRPNELEVLTVSLSIRPYPRISADP